VIANSTIDEALGLRVMNQADSISAARRKRFAEGLARTAAWVERHSAWVEWIRPDAGALCCVRLRREVFDQAGVARFHAALAARDARVGDGTWFGDEPHVFRVGFGFLPTPELELALDALSTALQQATRKAA
jgi:DNA-binding transcriptional MocR family regulator